MGREIRKVPENWEHPKDEHLSYKPLYEGYSNDASEFMTMAVDEGLQEAVDYMGCPNKEDYMPEWDDSEKTHLMMYETTSEGTPISPAFKDPEELAKWLSDTGASSFGSRTASYDQWLCVIRAGWAPSAIATNAGIVSGVEG